jgi:hypothetical protein
MASKMHDRVGAFRWVMACEWCGSAFWCGRSHARFCSGKCRVANHRFLSVARAGRWQENNPARQLSFVLNGGELCQE